MNSGSTIPYHLRHNKAIDRNLFVDLLARIGRYRNISDYEYIGFGGPFMEDFKHLHASLRLNSMISLEANEEVYKRQIFNKPVSCVETLLKTSGSFLTTHDFEKPSIVWFDYTSPGELAIQMAEIESLVSKLNPGDVFKITLNASADTLGSPADGSDLRTFRLGRAQEKLSDYCPAGASVDDVTAARYPTLLARAVEHAAKKGLRAKNGSIVESLAIFTYADGQRMLTVTAIVLSKIDRDKFLNETRLKHWKFYAENWSEPKSITIPQLSAKERMFVESMLPGETDPQKIIDDLGYRIGDDATEAARLMANFIHYYRLYPWYSKVVL